MTIAIAASSATAKMLCLLAILFSRYPPGDQAKAPPPSPVGEFSDNNWQHQS
jgi:hypothetical protein